MIHIFDDLNYKKKQQQINSVHLWQLIMKFKIIIKLNLPGVGVKWPPVEFGLELMIKCCCGWFKMLILVALFIVVIDRLAELCVWVKWWSRGGDTGSDLTLIAIGDVLGGGVLFDTAKWDKL